MGCSERKRNQWLLRQLFRKDVAGPEELQAAISLEKSYTHEHAQCSLESEDMRVKAM